MCDICKMTPCHELCPNAEQKRCEHICYDCKWGIEEGERYITVEDRYYHFDCICENHTAREVLDILGVWRFIA